MKHEIVISDTQHQSTKERLRKDYIAAVKINYTETVLTFAFTNMHSHTKKSFKVFSKLYLAFDMSLIYTTNLH